jgi:hypothetical protein
MALCLLSFHIPVLWLKPEIEIISRDRGGGYAAAARKGAPQAKQIADKFHLVVRRIGACLDSFQRKEGLRAKTPKTVAYLAGKPKEDSSMRQRQTCPKAFTARSACLARHGEARLPNLARPSAVRNARCCTERLLRRSRNTHQFTRDVKYTGVEQTSGTLSSGSDEK